MDLPRDLILERIPLTLLTAKYFINSLVVTAFLASPLSTSTMVKFPILAGQSLLTLTLYEH